MQNNPTAVGIGGDGPGDFTEEVNPCLSYAAIGSVRAAIARSGRLD